MRSLYTDVHSICPSFQSLQHYILLALSAMYCHHLLSLSLFPFNSPLKWSDFMFLLWFLSHWQNGKNPQATKSCRRHWQTSEEHRFVILGTSFTFNHIYLFRGACIMHIILLHITFYWFYWGLHFSLLSSLLLPSPSILTHSIYAPNLFRGSCLYKHSM